MAGIIVVAPRFPSAENRIVLIVFQDLLRLIPGLANSFILYPQ